MARIPAGDPDSVPARYRTCEREAVRRLTPDPRPAMRDGRYRAPEQVRREPFELRLDQRRRQLDVRVLGVEAHIALTPDEEASVGQLLPVVEATARVVRPVEEVRADR